MDMGTGLLSCEDTFTVVVVRPGTAAHLHRKFIFLFFLGRDVWQQGECTKGCSIGTEITSPSGMRTITVKSPSKGKNNLEFSLFPLSCMRNHGVSCNCGSSLDLLVYVASLTPPTL